MSIPFSSHSIKSLRLLSQREESARQRLNGIHYSRHTNREEEEYERAHYKDIDGDTEMGSIGQEVPVMGQTPFPTKAVLPKDFVWGFATAAYVFHLSCVAFARFGEVC